MDGASHVGFTNKLFHTTPTVAPGFYRVAWLAQIRHESNDKTIVMQIVIDGHVHDQYTVEGHNHNNDYESHSRFVFVEFLSETTHDIVMEAAVSAGTGHIRDATIEFWRIQ